MSDIRLTKHFVHEYELTDNPKDEHWMIDGYVYIAEEVDKVIQKLQAQIATLTNNAPSDVVWITRDEIRELDELRDANVTLQARIDELKVTNSMLHDMISGMKRTINETQADGIEKMLAEFERCGGLDEWDVDIFAEYYIAKLRGDNGAS